jgi:hypothetical protein
LIREHRVRGERDEEGEEEAGDDCWPEGVHAGSWGLMGNEEWGRCRGRDLRERGLGSGSISK